VGYSLLVFNLIVYSLIMRLKRIYPLITVAAFVFLWFVFWTLRSWNLEIGDGQFTCKQTIGPFSFPITLSRATLSHLLYRWMFFTLHPTIDWWVEDIIALSSCTAGVVFYFALFRLVWRSIEIPSLRVLGLVFPASSLLFNIFCGHIEFYPWTCALLMVSAFLAWKCLQRECSIFWPSAALALAFSFHSSGVFYFPALLILPLVISGWLEQRETWRKGFLVLGACFAVFIVAALVHRKAALYFDGELFKFDLLLSTPLVYVFSQANLLIAAAVLLSVYYAYQALITEPLRSELKPWWLVLVPWLVVFGIRTYFGLRAEPLLEHLPPVSEPYDTGSYLYMAFSWEHLYDKTMFHLWIAPFGLIGFCYFMLRHWQTVFKNGWLLYLMVFSVAALVWSTLFYPQLRTRDWDLFCSMAVPLNLFIFYCALRFWPGRRVLALFIVATLVQLSVMLPTAIKNAAILTHRGYVTVIYEPEPVEARAFLRGLELGITPLKQENIRAGEAEVRIVPVERGYLSWDETLMLRDGEVYEFSPELREAGEAHQMPVFPNDN